MRLIAKSVNTKEIKPFILDAQKDDDKGEQIVFNIRTALTYSELKFLKKLVIDDQVEATNAAFQMVIDSVDNFYYEDGKPVVIEKEKHPYAGVYKRLTEESATAIPEIAVNEISNHVFLEYFNLGRDDVKN